MPETNQSASRNCNAQVRGPVRTQWPPAWLRNRPREPGAADRRTDPAGEKVAQAVPLADEFHEPESPLAAEPSPWDGGDDEPSKRAPAELPRLDDAAWFDRLVETASDSPGGRWDDCPEWPEPCPRCNRVLVWWDLRGQTHCLTCDPPDKARRMAQVAARLRKQSGQPEPAGAAELRARFDEARRLTWGQSDDGHQGPKSP